MITGGAGLIGSHIADRLVAEGFEEIVVLDNFTRGRRQNLEPAIASGRVTIVEGDIRDPDLVLRAMDGIDIVFHEAAIRITHCAEDPRLAHDVLATGTFNILEAAVAAKVKRVVSASSASIYGQAEEFPTGETASRLRQPDDLRRHQELQRRTAAQLLRDVRTELCRAALLQRLRAAHGRFRRLHRGDDSLDGAAWRTASRA